MVFSSLVFMFAYLPLTLLIYYIVPRKGRNIFLFFINLLFYGWGEPKLIVLMLINIAVNYIGGYLVDKFKDEEDVIEKANDSRYGLAGGIYSNDIYRIMKVANGMRTGRVWVNTYNQFPAGAPFGGYKDSGIGRETDKLALEAYTQVKNIIIDSSKEKLGFY